MTERKDVLSGLFFLLTLAAYVGYARRPFSLRRYLLLGFVFALGLLAKQSLVTLPLLLLLLDYWPLRRMGSAAQGFSFPRPLIAEKVPLFVLSGVSSLVAVWAASGTQPGEPLSLWWRIGNAPISYVAYLGQFFYPRGLAAFYPRPGLDLPMWKIGGACLILLAITVAVCVGRRRCPYLLVGWLWYLAVLLPVIGLVQVGIGGHGRPLHVPTADWLVHCLRLGEPRIWFTAGTCDIGPAASRWRCCLLCLWGPRGGRPRFGETARPCGPKPWPARRRTLWPTTTWALRWPTRGGSAKRSPSIMSRWRSSPTTPRPSITWAWPCSASGGWMRPSPSIRRCSKCGPVTPRPSTTGGAALARLGRFDEAMADYRQAVELKPDYFEAHNNLAIALANQGRFQEAMAR